MKQDTKEGRENGLYKLQTLTTALNVFRAAFVEEFELYDRREGELAEPRT